MNFWSLEKEVQKSESLVFKKLTKSIVATVSIPTGSIIDSNMLTTKGPGTGISPMKMNELIGKKTITDILEDTIIQESQIEW